MAEQSNIAWTHATFNPWMGCTKVSQGCKHCYAETLTKNRMGIEVWGPTATRQRTSAAYWRQPLAWAKQARLDGERRRVFCGSLCDIFEDHPVANRIRPEVFDLVYRTPELDWLLLTKRAENIAPNLPLTWTPNRPWPNVWLGTSIEDRKACSRRDELVKVPAAIHFLSIEPLLEDIADAIDLSGIEWAVVGGESGPDYRPMDHQWARNLEAKCKESGTAFFFKQSAAIRAGMGTMLDGRIRQDYPFRILNQVA